MAEGGLLDFLSSPAGMGLLSAAAGGMAGARRGAPWNTAGAALLGGVSGYQQAMEQQPMRKLQELMSGGGQKPNPQAMQLGQMPTKENAAALAAMPKQPARPAIMSLTPDQLAPFLFNKGTSNLVKNIIDYQEKLGKVQTVNPEHNTVDFYGNKTGEGYKLGEGWRRDASGNPYLDPNYAKQSVEYTGQVEDAKEKAKSRNTLLPLGYTRGGVPVGGSVGDYLGGQQGAPRINPQSVPQKGAKSTPANWSAINQEYAAGAGKRQSEQLTILQQERAKATDPNDIAMLDREIKRFGGQPTAPAPTVQAPTNTGQLDSEADKAAALAKVATDQAAATDQAKRIVELKFNAPKMVAKADSAIKAIDEALTHKGLGTATGLQGMVDLRNYIPGTDAYDFRVRLDQLKGKTFMEAFESLKGGGQITEVEGQKATDAIARLNRAQSRKEFEGGLKDLKDVIAGSKSRLAAQISGQPVSATTRSTDDILKQYGVR